MITFFPRDIGIWRNEFDFSQGNSMTLECKPQSDRKVCYDRKELIEFMKSRGVRLDDPKHPLQFIGPKEHHQFGYVYDVIQFHLLGWVKE